MIRGLTLSLAAMAAIAPQIRADEKPALEPGYYFVYYSFQPSSPEQVFALIKVEKKGGKLVGSLEASPPNLSSELKEFTVDGRNVLVAFDLGGRILTFEGLVDAKDPRIALGSFGDDKLLSRGRLVATEKNTIERADMSIPAKIAEPLAKLTKLSTSISALRFKVNMAKGDDAVAAKKALEEAQSELKAETEKKPALYKEVLEKHGDSPQVVESAVALLKGSPNADDAAKWIKSVERYAERYGTRFQIDTIVKCAAALGSQKGFETTTLELADKAAKLMSDKTDISIQVRVLKVLRDAQEKAGKADLARQTDVRLTKLEEQIDREYLAKVPPFKPTKFQGRKNMSDRVAVFELFTGAQCPPCVAADVAFDALLKSYKPTELVMIQYHMHIPGPDPMTNPDTEARWKYYIKEGMRAGVPYSIFNGKPQGGGGGGMAASETKYKQYKGIIDSLLEEENNIKIGGSVTSRGDKIAIKIDVDGIKEANDNLKLRLVLVEETIKYVGGNGIRMHHQVVRAMPGGVDGMAIKEKSGSQTAEVDLTELRKKLKAYLEDFEKDGGEFSNPNKPLALKNLRVIAMLQDDGTKEILQAVQFEVPEAK